MLVENLILLTLITLAFCETEISKKKSKEIELIPHLIKIIEDLTQSSPSNSNTECKCENGFCDVDSSDGQLKCKCLPEFGLYSETRCKACYCGIGANCTFDVGFFSTKVECICPKWSKKGSDNRCEDPCNSNPCQNEGACNVNLDGLNCDCLPSYTGKFCEIERTTFKLTRDDGLNFTLQFNQTTFDPYNFTFELNQTTIDPYNFTLDFNQTTFDPYNFTFDFNQTTFVPYNFTFDFNQTTFDPYNFTFEFNQTTVDPYNFTLNFNQTTFDPYNFTFDFNQTTFDPYNFTFDFNQTTIDPYNFTLDFNQTTFEPFNFTFDFNQTTFDPYNFTFDFNQTTFYPYNFTFEHNQTTVDPYNFTLDFNQTTYEPFNFTFDFNQTTLSPGNFTFVFNQTTLDPFNFTFELNQTIVDPYNFTFDLNQTSDQSTSKLNSDVTGYMTSTFSPSTLTSTTYRSTTKKIIECNCGIKSIACKLDIYGNQNCLCIPGFSQLGKMCRECNCGQFSNGCYFDAAGNKKCLCEAGFGQRNGSCLSVCVDDSGCYNGGLCSKDKNGIGFCKCLVDYSGDRCEFFDACAHLEISCNLFGAICRVVDGKPHCECPPGKAYDGNTGNCKDLCTRETCFHGSCDIYGNTYKCRCDKGYTGDHCDEPTNILENIEFEMIVFIVFSSLAILFSISSICFMIVCRSRSKADYKDHRFN